VRRRSIVSFMDVPCTKLTIRDLEIWRTKVQENAGGTALLLHVEADITKSSVLLSLQIVEKQTWDHIASRIINSRHKIMQKRFHYLSVKIPILPPSFPEKAILTKLQW
jgi:hypothetical protein